MTPECGALNTGLEWGGAIAAAIALGIVFFRGRAKWNPFIFGREAVIIAVGLLTYFGVRGLTEGSLDAALAHSQSIVDLERSLGIFWEPDLQSSIADQDCMVAVANWVYIWWHWPIIAVAAVWLLLNRPGTYTRFRNAFLISGGIGLVVFATYPVAPPRLLGGLDVIDTVSIHSGGYRVLQPPAFTNQYAALPSLHYGWNLLIGLALLREAPALLARLFGLLMPVAMAAAVVLTANHYIIDAVAGAALALFGLLVAVNLGRIRGGALRLRRGRAPCGARG